MASSASRCNATPYLPWANMPQGSERLSKAASHLLLNILMLYQRGRNKVLTFRDEELANAARYVNPRSMQPYFRELRDAGFVVTLAAGGGLRTIELTYALGWETASKPMPERAENSAPRAENSAPRQVHSSPARPRQSAQDKNFVSSSSGEEPRETEPETKRDDFASLPFPEPEPEVVVTPTPEPQIAAAAPSLPAPSPRAGEGPFTHPLPPGEGRGEGEDRPLRGLSDADLDRLIHRAPGPQRVAAQVEKACRRHDHEATARQPESKPQPHPRPAPKPAPKHAAASLPSPSPLAGEGWGEGEKCTPTAPMAFTASAAHRSPPPPPPKTKPRNRPRHVPRFDGISRQQVLAYIAAGPGPSDARQHEGWAYCMAGFLCVRWDDYSEDTFEFYRRVFLTLDKPTLIDLAGQSDLPGVRDSAVCFSRRAKLEMEARP